MANDQPVHPLLAEYDQKLHAVTEQMRRDHPDWWFSYTSAKIKPTNPQRAASISHQTEIVKPK